LSIEQAKQVHLQPDYTRKRRERLIFGWFLLVIVGLADLHESQNHVHIRDCELPWAEKKNFFVPCCSPLSQFLNCSVFGQITEPPEPMNERCSQINRTSISAVLRTVYPRRNLAFPFFRFFGIHCMLNLTCGNASDPKSSENAHYWLRIDCGDLCLLGRQGVTGAREF